MDHVYIFVSCRVIYTHFFLIKFLLLKWLFNSVLQKKPETLWLKKTNQLYFLGANVLSACVLAIQTRIMTHASAVLQWYLNRIQRMSLCRTRPEINKVCLCKILRNPLSRAVTLYSTHLKPSLSVIYAKNVCFYFYFIQTIKVQMESSSLASCSWHSNNILHRNVPFTAAWVILIKHDISQTFDYKWTGWKRVLTFYVFLRGCSDIPWHDTVTFVVLLFLFFTLLSLCCPSTSKCQFILCRLERLLGCMKKISTLYLTFPSINGHDMTRIYSIHEQPLEHKLFLMNISGRN